MKKIIVFVLAIGFAIAGLYYGYVTGNLGKSDLEFISPGDNKATSSPVSRTETVRNLIDKLQAEREQDPTFKAKTVEMEKELEAEIASMRQALKDHRKAQSRLDALTIIQTQYDVELNELEKANKVVLK